ncbi:MAG: hypothetical protein DBY32_08070 [Phascolarctobacterium sp.]|nr:MAG: hypothetical protein DBY32_08070 [Phascolarctobacterium sp.]
MTGLNAFFVISEYALVSIRPARLEEMIAAGNSRAELVLKMTQKRDTYLSAIQLGITASSLILGWFCGPVLAGLMADWFDLIGEHWYDDGVVVLCTFLLIVFVHVVFGELVPRVISLAHVERAAMMIAYPLIFFYYLMYPLVIFFNNASHAVLKLLKMDKVPVEDISRSEEELRMIVSASERGGKLDHMESRLLDNVFDFADRVAREVMVPRQDMVCLYVEDSFEKNIQKVLATRHTRYPLCEEDKDHVLGVIHVRSLLNVSDEDKASFDIRSRMNSLTVVPESMEISKVLQTMQQKRVQLVVVADEYGGTAGLVTMEDLLEEIVGDIQDEHDEDKEEEVVHRADGTYEFAGIVLLDDIQDFLHIKFEEPEEDTIGGLVFGLLERKPEIGDKIEVDGWCFEVLRTEGFRVTRVRASKLPEMPVYADE